MSTGNQEHSAVHQALSALTGGYGAGLQTALNNGVGPYAGNIGAIKSLIMDITLGLADYSQGPSDAKLQAIEEKAVDILGGMMGATAGQAILGAAVPAAASALGIAAVGPMLPWLVAGAALGAVAASLMGSEFYDSYNNWFKENVLFKLMDIIFTYGTIETAVGDLYDDAKQYIRPRSPITLDLDGDGVETVGLSSTGPVMFDHNGDGVKIATGWVSSDDGMLVFDRNGNGTIDNGTELFGDSTALYAGGTASDGFAALQQEDTNGNGVVNNLDTNWAQLKVWRDLNQDGISQTDELYTMDQVGIAAINVADTENSVTLTNGNLIGDLGTYTKTDGSTGNMADVYFKVDTFEREFTDTIPLAAGVEDLPDMQGSGMVRDLQEAASQSTSLQDLLTQYSQATTRQEQMALLDQLLDAWADTSGMTETLDDRDSEDYRIRYDSFGSVTRSGNLVSGNTAVSNNSGSGFQPYVRDVGTGKVACPLCT